MQGRAGYGGLVGALALTSMRKHVPPARKVRSLLVSFVGPVGPGDFSIHARVLRSGKAVTHVEAKVVQREAVRCVVMGSFGGDRDSAIRIDPAPRPEMAGPAEALELPYIDGLTPAFTRHFAYRWALGELPLFRQGRPRNWRVDPISRAHRLPHRRVAGGPGRCLAHAGTRHAHGPCGGKHVNLGDRVPSSEPPDLCGR